MTASARFCESATCADSEPPSSAKPCTLTSQLGYFCSQATCWSSVVLATESSSADPFVKKVRRPTLRMKSSSLPPCMLANPGAASLVDPPVGGGWLSTVVSSILVVVQPASRASRPAKASLRKSVPAIICCCPLQSTACYSSVGSSTGLDLPAWSAMCGSTWTYVPIGQR